jgi:hypothetical protein
VSGAILFHSTTCRFRNETKNTTKKIMKTMKQSFTLNKIIVLNGALIVSCLSVLVLAASCASTEVTNRQRIAYDRLPRPNQIVVYDFAASPAEVPADSALAGQGSVTTPTDEEVAVGRQLGVSIAAQLVADIGEMGLPAVQVSTQPVLKVNDIVIRGYLVSIEQGSTAKRMTVGFGSGGSEMRTVVEGYQMTASGLRKLGSATLGSEGSKGPGAAVGGAAWLITGNPVGLIVGGGMKIYGEASGNATIEGRAKATAKEISDQLKIRFQEEGWIN